MTAAVHSIAKFAESSENTTPEMALIDALDDLRSGAKAFSRVLVIRYEEDAEGHFGMGFYCSSGMRLSDHLSLIEMHKSTILRDMGLT
jgi:hypothetical protein